MGACMMTLSAIAAAAFGDPCGGILQTRNPDPCWIDPTPLEYAAQEAAYEDFAVRRIMGPDDPPEVVILLEEGLADSVGTDLLRQWIDDIQREYGAQALEVSYGRPEQIRGLLDSLHADGLVGAVLVGNLPAAWTAVWDTEVGAAEECPTDYFLMDLDGRWMDIWVGCPRDSVPGEDGFYDTFEGALDPEIWVGRIRVDNLSALGDPMDMLRAYLERNHQWRLTGDPQPVRALCFVDDDWEAYGDVFAGAMQLLYPDVTLCNRSPETTERNYEENMLTDCFVWISPFVHSDPDTHYWMPEGGTTAWREIAALDPHARFYNLFACSNCRFTSEHCMGSVYSFATGSGLAAVGSTTSGAMLRFDEFYGPLGGGGSLGEAYQLWWEAVAEDGFSQSELNWHIGMVLLGDPTLVPAMHQTGVWEEPGGEPFALSVSPNPSGAGSPAVVSVASPFPATVDVFDLSGRLMEHALLDGGGPGEFSLQAGGLPPGVYLVRASSGGSEAVLSFVVLE